MTDMTVMHKSFVHFYSLFWDSLIQCNRFSYHLYDDDLKIYLSIPDKPKVTD